MSPLARALPIATLLCLCACNRDPTPAHAAPPTLSTSVASVADTMPAEVSARVERILGDPDRYAAVIVKLKQAVGTHDPAAVAALVQYPIEVTIDGKATTITDAQSFALHYDRIVTEGIAAAITGTQYADLMVSQRGIMFGSGEVWINGVCADEKCQRFEPRVIAIQPIYAAQPPAASEN